jgi:hypothetical protein
MVTAVHHAQADRKGDRLSKTKLRGRLSMYDSGA